jgi:capsular exopolysaccharide synthesis family protein
MSINEHEFYKRSFFDKIAEYKLSIAIITLLFILLAVVYLLNTPKIYRTDATLEVIPKYDLLSSASAKSSQESEYNRHFVTQMDFLQSRHLVSKVVRALQANIVYYKNGRIKPFKIIQDDSPFWIKNLHIKDDDFYDKVFHIELVDKDHYALRLMDSSNIGSKIFDKALTKPLVYRFSKPVHSDYMDFTIVKNRFSKQKDVYFKVEHERSYVDHALKNLMVIKNSEKSSIIKIIYDDYTPKGAKKFVDTLIKEYMKVVAGNQASLSIKHLKLLDSELELSKKRLNEAERKLQKFIERNKVSGIGVQTSNLINTIYKYEGQLESLDIEYQNIKTIYNIYKKSYDYKDILTRISQLKNPNLIKLVDSISKDENEYKKLRKLYKNRHPSVKQVRRSIAQKSVTLDRNLRQLLKNAQSKRRKLKSYIDKYRKNLTTVPHKEIGYAKLKREYDLIEKNYISLLDKKRQINLSKKVQGDYNYRVLDYPFVPEHHAKPKKSLLLILGTILGLLFGILYALVRAYFAKKITVPSEVEELTRSPYLGTIPYIKNKKLYNDLFVAKEPNSIASQMMWSLRDRVDSFKGENGSQVIAITSMVKGEGKTTLAANLAICLGMGDKKTVVLSLDLRLPEIHSKFGINNNIGLSSVLFGNHKLNEVVYRSNEFKNLYVIPSGPKISNPMQIINSNYIDVMLKELRELYDYIIIDLPPAGVAAESLHMMKKADLVISVLKSRYSEKSFVTYMESITLKNGIKNLGFVLNGVNKKYIKIIARKENKKYINHNKKYVK